MTEVRLWGALRPSAGGASSVEIEAVNIRELLRKLSERYPGMESYLDGGVSVSVDGVIYRDNWDKAIAPDAEVYLLPRIEGG